MPLPLAAAAIVARRAALSAARKGKGAAKKKFKRDLGRMAKIQGGPISAEARKKIGWPEIILVILLIALPNDLLDIINLTGIGKLVTIFIEPITLFFLFAWFWVRVREKPSKKIVKNALTFIAEIIPFIGLFPLWTLLVINVKTGWLDKLLAIPMKLLSFGK